ncbi:50S ribosomal protein L25/general stress protein Ctc [Dermacoccus nishinomiyaensis]|uniref:50S ribosomal protein L25/general stress protein Ctc n=1 Tax=Dermacoccus nishinomiyaensis TaxID=1274 RepID=UPI00093ABF18|nr:50S ribosomal protein L25/general stress protein Ctc [Dermacoccus nishinomiyaensis]
MAADQIVLEAQLRTEFGKGAARRIRRNDMIPAVLYGHGETPVHLELPGHDTMMAVKNPNALLTIRFDGKEELALARDVQREVIRRFIEHVDLVIVKKGEKVEVDVPVHAEGEAAAETVVTTENGMLTVLTPATDIPEAFTVSVEGAEAGTQILAKEITLPSGVELVSDEEMLVINVTEQISAEALDAELAEAEAEAGIEHEESDQETEGDDAAEAPAEGDAAEGSEDSE